MFYVPGPEHVIAVMQSKGYKVFEGGGYDLNIFGVRTRDTSANLFNDWLGVMYRHQETWNLFSFPATTDPGLYWREHPMNVDGTAIVKPGQYRGSHQIGMHKGYSALTQVKPVVVYRDADRDGDLDLDESATHKGVFGINIHRASRIAPSAKVDRWSAGCQVFQDALHLQFLLNLARKSAETFGNSFTYTLLTEADFT